MRHLRGGDRRRLRIELLATIPGISATTAQVILAENRSTGNSSSITGSASGNTHSHGMPTSSPSLVSQEIRFAATDRDRRRSETRNPGNLSDRNAQESEEPDIVDLWCRCSRT
jgi:hypothetical protein